MDFVIFSSINWNDQDGAHRPTQISRALSRRNHRVLFVQIPLGPPVVEEGIETTSLLDLGLSESEIRSAWFGFNDTDLGPLAYNLEKRLEQFEHAKTRVAIWMAPFVPFVRLFPLLSARGYHTVYDCIDDFVGLYEVNHYFANVHAEDFLVRYSDLVTVVSSSVAQRLSEFRNIEQLPCGADLSFRAHAPVPDDLLRGDVTLGFWGTIADDFVDADLVVYVARERPRWSINLIGPYDLDHNRPSVADTLRGVPNVRLLGRRPHKTLMNYLAGIDVCLMPFPDNKFSRGRDPIKLYEYLAGYKPVVTLHTPQLKGRPAVYLANSHLEFLSQVDIARSLPVKKQIIDEFLQENSWDARADTLLKLVFKSVSRASEFQEQVLPSTFDDPNNVNDRRQALIRHLEQIADERLAYIRELERNARLTAAYTARLERTNPFFLFRRLLGFKLWRR